MLALRLARHEDGLVDAYFGPKDLFSKVASEPPAEPARLADEAAHLGERLKRADLEPQRVAWLEAQTHALGTVAARAAKSEIAWADEVEHCFGVRPRLTPTETFERAHVRLDRALPGTGELRERYQRWLRATEVDRDLVLPALRALASEFRLRAHEIVDFPESETVTYEPVFDQPWYAYNWYLGNMLSRVEVNLDIRMHLADLPLLAAHEAYPGHHTERACKEHRLLRTARRLETSLVLTTGPEVLISEGLAMIALDRAFEEPHRVVARILAPMGIDYDPELMGVVCEVGTVFDRVRTNGAILLYGEGRPEDDVATYLREWTLEPEDSVQHAMRFLTDETSRAYASAYTDGADLCSRYVEREPEGFVKLLTEQLTTADLQRVISAGPERTTDRFATSADLRTPN